MVRQTVLLELNALDERITPIVGSTAVPAAVGSGSFTGVVQIATTVYQREYPWLPREFQTSLGTGSLFRTGQGSGFGHHVLTAAHVTTAADPATRTKDMTVFFHLHKGDQRYDVPITVFAGVK